MAKSISTWGIDIGQRALKALKLSDVDGELVVEAIDIVEHPTILSQSGGKEKELIHNALVTFMTRNKIGGATVAISVPGQSSFTRFVKLPPVESKRVPDIVRFEAEQQIPFPMEEVIWRWQIFQDPDSPDVEVGIFAMKRTDVDQTLDYFSEAGLKVDLVQMAPLSLYNFMCFDEQVADDGATLLMDIGTDKTDLVVADGSRLWTRTIQIGGGNFTQALVKAFKLSFHKAEQLKRTAATSKYAKQVFQSMRPVFSDLVQEVQRSIGYYTSLHRETLFKRLVGLGNGFRLPGLQRFLEQNLNMPVARVDAYNKVKPGKSVSAATFSENVLSFAVAYGTALAAMGRGRIHTNLLPVEIVQGRLWKRKRVWFAAAAVVLLAALAGPVFRAYADRKILASSADFPRAERVADDIQELRNAYDQLKNKGRKETEQINSYLKLFAYHDFLPSVQTLISRSIRDVALDQLKLVAYPRNLELLAQAKAELALAQKKADAEAVKTLSDEIKRIEQSLKSFTDIPRPERRIIIVEKMLISYVTGPAKGESRRPAAAAGAGKEIQRRVSVTITIRTPRPQDAINNMLSALRGKCLALKSSLISDVEDVPDWSGLVTELKRAGKDPPESLRRRIWEQFSAGLKQQITSMKDGSAPTDATRRTIIKEINSLLASKELWRKTDWDKIKLGQWEKRFQRKVEKGTAEPSEIVHLNRAGLQAAFPKHMPGWHARELRSVGFHDLEFRYAAGKGGGASGKAGPGETGRPMIPDPLFKGENMADDTRLDITVTLSVADDGLELDDDEQAGKVRP